MNPYTQEQEQWLDYFAGGEKVAGDYTSLEFAHMDDVKRIMERINYVVYICLISVLGIIFYYRKDKKELSYLGYYGGIISVLGGVLLLLMMIFSFNLVFNVFHQIFFPQGNWQFPTEALLIQTFPLDFFISLSVKIFLLALFLGLMFWGTGYYLRKKI